MEDQLYEQFCDPSEDFNEEPRAFCHGVALSFVDQAKNASPDNWCTDHKTIKGILLLLFTWNFAARETKKLTFQNVGELLSESASHLRAIQAYTIETADEGAWPHILAIFDCFRGVMGQTGASKALSLLNPHLFVMWDTKIRQRLNRALIPGIENGQTGEHYVQFLKGIQRIINEYHIKEKLPETAVIAKKIDEYNYVQIIMKKP